MFSPISARSFLVDSSIYVYREACESFDFTCDGSACSRPHERQPGPWQGAASTIGHDERRAHIGPRHDAAAHIVHASERLMSVRRA